MSNALSDVSSIVPVKDIICLSAGPLPTAVCPVKAWVTLALSCISYLRPCLPISKRQLVSVLAAPEEHTSHCFYTSQGYCKDRVQASDAEGATSGVGCVILSADCSNIIEILVSYDYTSHNLALHGNADRKSSTHFDFTDPKLPFALSHN